MNSIPVRYLVRNILMAWLACLPGWLAAAADIHISLPTHRLLPEELAVIVNDADPLSRRIGRYYIEARDLPPENLLHVRFKPGRNNMSPRKFAALKRAIDAATPAGIQAYAITWIAPYRVDCMSITAAIGFGFDRSLCSRARCEPTRKSRYYGYSGTRPAEALGLRPTMSIAARTFDEARALIDRGIAADGTHPTGTAYLVSTHDKARNVRAALYPRISTAMQGWIETEVVNNDTLRERDDVMFYFTGLPEVTGLDTLNFVPGAVADHLTSAGGRLTGSKQMSALRWLEAGATGSFGTVVEPCNLPGKFPNPGLMIDLYTSGRTLIEAYWQSVEQPGEGIFIGEPLSAPYDGFTFDVEGGHIVLHTRTLQPGRYRLEYAPSPIGPYRKQPGVIRSAYHQNRFDLPLLGPGYYRLSAY